MLLCCDMFRRELHFVDKTAVLSGAPLKSPCKCDLYLLSSCRAWETTVATTRR